VSRIEHVEQDADSPNVPRVERRLNRPSERLVRRDEFCLLDVARRGVRLSVVAGNGKLTTLDHAMTTLVRVRIPFSPLNP
jgi:hypothetical protein